MSGIEARRSLQHYLKNWTSCLCHVIILSVILFVTDTNNIYTCLNVRGLNTGNNNQLYIPTANPSTFQMEVTGSHQTTMHHTSSA
jgi:hypothetical protein